MNVIKVDFTRRHCPAGALALHPRFGVCPVLEASGLHRLIEVVEDGDDTDWFRRRIERVPVTDLREVPSTPE